MKKKEQKKKSATLELNAIAKRNALRNNIIIASIVLFVLALFYKTINYDFVNWDDPDYVTGNLLIRDFSLQGFGKIFTTPIIGMYNPLPFIIYAIQYKIWGLDPKYFHLFNVLFHLISIITVFRFIYKLTKRYETATIVALLFAVHPMHISVVTWVSETKTSLFLIFYFLALSNYTTYITSNYKKKYLVYVGIFFLLSALSKPEAVTLAPMLFLLDYYLSRKMEWKIFIEKIPFFAIALFFGILTLLTHRAEGDSIFEVNHNYSLINNLLLSNYSIVFYINSLFYPKHLTTIYAYPDNSTYLPIQYYLSIPVIPIIIFLIYKSGKFRKELIFGVLFFVIAVSILIRIVPSGFFGMANWYSYLSYTGLFFIIGQFMVYNLDNEFAYSRKAKLYLLGVLSYFIIYCSWKTSRRIDVWQNSVTLFDDVIKKEPKLLMAYNQRAVAKASSGDYKGAIDDLSKTIEIDSNYAEGYNNRGAIKKDIKDYAGALIDVNKALRLNPKYSDAYNNRANIESDNGKYESALQDYDSALLYDPKLGQAYYNRALVRLNKQDTTGAVNDWKKAASLGIQQAGPCLATYCSSD
jgi:tetratricopeptide (TPR) repeat protein